MEKSNWWIKWSVNSAWLLAAFLLLILNKISYGEWLIATSILTGLYWINKD